MILSTYEIDLHPNQRQLKLVTEGPVSPPASAEPCGGTT
jgi:hypothetical protein